MTKVASLSRLLRYIQEMMMRIEPTILRVTNLIFRKLLYIVRYIKVYLLIFSSMIYFLYVYILLCKSSINFYKLFDIFLYKVF